ncbi:hypothetical protein GCM10009547_29240 [Sporichthya brevicatena]|uniref:Peptidase S8/S53 domain-containing protein n=1 Tax=Sporichthya brevicatena TaxID=171442 RepID=A0ABN1GZ93_9ACTN
MARRAAAGAAVLTGALVLALVGAPAPHGAAADDPCAVQAADYDGDRFVVLLDDDATPEEVAAAADEAAAKGATVHFRYEYAVKGYAATLPPRAQSAVEDDTDVAAVEPDLPVCLSSTDAPSALAATQNPAPWALDRIDQRSRSLDGRYSWGNDGTGVTAFVIDSGVRATHSEFAGRVAAGADFTGLGSTDDVLGHGTRVAGLLGGQTWGAAKGVTLVPVRIFGSTAASAVSVVIAGINHVLAARAANPAAPMVANLSLGVRGHALDAAVANLVAAGVTTVVAAGNRDGADACTESPAAQRAAITVAASTINDARASFSNVGSCVDLFAPGDDLVSSSPATDTSAEGNLDGTSYAAPLVAGVAATYLQANPGATPAQVESLLTRTATPGVIADAGPGTPNRLLFSPLTPPPAPPAPAPRPTPTPPKARASKPVPRCLGRPATIVGTAGPDRIRGTKRADVIVGLGGADRIEGRGGADLICGGRGNDILIGGGGDDVILGGPGRDRIKGGRGNDRCRGGAGRDVITGC